MISCDKGKTRVEGRGDVILAEWGTLTFAVLRGFVNSEKEMVEKDEELQENLKEVMRENLEVDFERAFSNKTDEELERRWRNAERKYFETTIRKFE